MDNYIDRILNVGKSKGLKAKDIADIIDIRPQSVSGWKTGKAGPSGDSLVKLIEIWEDVDARWLLTGKEENKSKQLTNTMIGSYQRNIQDSHVVNDGGAEEILKIKLDAALEIIKEKEEQIKLLKNMLKM